MSFILDALNKAENERHLGHVPTIESQQAAFTEEKKTPTIAIAVIVALTLNFALLAYVFLGKNNPAEQLKGIPGQEISATQVKPEIKLSDNNSLNNEKILPSDIPLSIANKVEANKSIVSKASTNTNLTGEKMLSPLDDVNEKMAALLKKNNAELVVEAKTTMGKENMGTDNSIQENESFISQNKSLSAYLDIPLLTQKSAEFQQQIPDLSIDVHVYSAVPTKRFILINLQKYQEDDVIAKGLMLEQITEEGLILSYQDERFRWPMLTQ